jgi:excisionase family DNA binding protein
MSAIETSPVRAVSIEEAARQYGLSKSTFRRAIQSRQLRAARVGRRIVIRISELEKWLASLEPGDRPDPPLGAEETSARSSCV